MRTQKGGGIYERTLGRVAILKIGDNAEKTGKNLV